MSKLDEGKEYFSESFLNQTNGNLNATFLNRKMISKDRKGSAIISLDANVTPELQSALDGSSFLLQEVNSNGSLIQNNRLYNLRFDEMSSFTNFSAKCIFMNSA